MNPRFVSALFLLGFSASVAAGPFNDKLAICLVKSATESDKTVLMRWVFGAMASHPNVSDLGSVSPVQGAKLSRDAAALFMDLIANRCGSETKEAIKYEGAEAISLSFELLGKVAMQGLMSDAEVKKYMAGLDDHLDAKALQSLLPVPAGSP